MKLSDQALGSIMMALQKSLLEESDIVPVLKSFELVLAEGSDNELLVINPPTFKIEQEDSKFEVE
jgi:hypothetical protein